MRVGFNPNKDKELSDNNFLHQIIIPVYIPNDEDYFKDAFRIFKISLESLLATTHNKTFITIVNNGSSPGVKTYLDDLLGKKLIQEVIHTENIGKLNSILKGLAGNDIELVTISDADVLFLPGWQNESVNIFNKIPKAGVVGIVPQFKMYESNCGNLIFDNFFNPELKFIPVKNPKAIVRFYDSIGWERNYNQDYLKYTLGLKISDTSVYVGSGHFVATYKKEIFDEIVTNIPYKMGGISEQYLDEIPLKKGYWRVTTSDNYAYHMGNVFEEWMKMENQQNVVENIAILKSSKRPNGKWHFVKDRLFVKMFSVNWTDKLFLRFKKLPVSMIDRY